MTLFKAEINLYDELIIYSAGGAILYRGKPGGYPVEKSVVLETGNIVVLLKDGEKKYGAFENLLLLNSDGTVIWHAQLPTQSSTDAYVDFEVTEGKLFANSWSCHRVEIEMERGKIVGHEFVK